MRRHGVESPISSPAPQPNTTALPSAVALKAQSGDPSEPPTNSPERVNGRIRLESSVGPRNWTIITIMWCEGAHVVASDPLTPNQAIAATADENGDAEIVLYEGREYRLIAATFGYREPACAGPVKFIAKPGLQLGTLTLDKTWNQCRALQRGQ